MGEDAFAREGVEGWGVVWGGGGRIVYVEIERVGVSVQVGVSLSEGVTFEGGRSGGESHKCVQCARTRMSMVDSVACVGRKGVGTGLVVSMAMRVGRGLEHMMVRAVVSVSVVVGSEEVVRLPHV